MNHIDSVLFTREEVDFFNHVLDFLKNPVARTAAAGEQVFRPYCENLLTKIKMKFRLRGI